MSVHTYIPAQNYPQKHPDPSMYSCFCRGTHSSMLTCAQTACTHIPCSLLSGPNSTNHYPLYKDRTKCPDLSISQYLSQPGIPWILSFKAVLESIWGATKLGLRDCQTYIWIMTSGKCLIFLSLSSIVYNLVIVNTASWTWRC